MEEQDISRILEELKNDPDLAPLIHEAGDYVITPSKRLFFINEEILTVDIEIYGGLGIAKIRAKENENFKFYFYQFKRVCWDKNGERGFHYIITNGKKYNIVDLGVEAFKQKCHNKRVKAIVEGGYWCLSKCGHVDEFATILERFKQRDYESISGKYKRTNLYGLEVLD